MIFDEILGDYPDWKPSLTFKGWDTPDWWPGERRITGVQTSPRRVPGIAKRPRPPKKKLNPQPQGIADAAMERAVADEPDTAVFVQQFPINKPGEPTTEVFRRPNAWDASTGAHGALSSTQKIKLLTETRIDPRPGGTTHDDEPVEQPADHPF